MSNEARDWAWSVPDPPSWARIVLLALAEHVGDGGRTCFPGQARLAVTCGVSERQLRNALRELERRELIAIEHRPGQGGGRRSNVYRLAISAGQTLAQCPQATGAPAPANGNTSAAQPEMGFRNCGSELPQPTGNPAQCRQP